MRKQFTEAVKGRQDGAAILKALKITDATNFSDHVVASIKATIQLIDQNKMTPEEAGAQILKAAQGTNPADIAATLRERAEQTSAAIASTINHVDEQVAGDAVKAYLGALSEGLQFHLTQNTARQAAGEVIDLGEFSLMEEMKKLPPRPSEQKALPSNSESK